MLSIKNENRMTKQENRIYDLIVNDHDKGLIIHKALKRELKGWARCMGGKIEYEQKKEKGRTFVRLILPNLKLSGKAQCNKNDDVFSPLVGTVIAEHRLLNKILSLHHQS